MMKRRQKYPDGLEVAEALSADCSAAEIVEKNSATDFRGFARIKPTILWVIRGDP